MELSASVGLVLDPWQVLGMEVMLGERPGGRWSAFEFGLLVSRQNGKGALLECRALAGLFLFGEMLLVHSAHQFKTAQEAFLRIKGLIDGSDDLRRRVRRIRTSHGEEGIDLRSGARLRFLARSRTSGRGFTGDVQILDEAQELSGPAMAALLPTLSARRNPQVVYTGTVPERANDSAHWESLRDRGRTGQDPTLAWMEWSPADEHPDLDDRDVWAETNPALGYRITEEAIERERASLSDEDFARERLSHWGAAGVASVLDPARWAELADPGSQVVDPVAFAVDIPPDRSGGSVAIAGRRADGLRHVEVVDAHRGTGWIVARVADLVERWSPKDRKLPVALDASSPAGSLVAGLRERQIEPMTLSSREHGQACGALYDRIEEGTVRHIGQPALASAVGGARKRPLGDAWAWHRKDAAVDISPLVAVTFALFAHEAEAAERAAAKTRTGNVW